MANKLQTENIDTGEVITVDPPQTLVRYANPIQDPSEPVLNLREWSGGLWGKKSVDKNIDNSNSGNDINNDDVKSEEQINNHCRLSSEHLKQLEDLIPNRKIVDDCGRKWIQRVSKVPGHREDQVRLQELLDEALKDRRARDVGICKIREQLYTQTFNELIRQCMLENPERGPLMIRIKDEFKQSIKSYQTLYQNSVSFGVVKKLQAEHGIPEMEEKIIRLTNEKKALETKVNELRQVAETMDKDLNEQRSVKEKQRKEELNYIRFCQSNMEAKVKQLTASIGGSAPGGK